MSGMFLGRCSDRLVVGFVVVVVPLIVASFLRNVDAGTIRLVSWLAGGTVTYRGPGKSKEIPLLTTGTTISSKVINIDLDITDQTADIDENGTPRPIKVRVLASAIVSVGDSRCVDQDGGEPLLLEERRRSAEHADRSALQLRSSRHEPAHARSALLGQGHARRSARSAAGASPDVLPVRAAPIALTRGGSDRARGRGRSARRDHPQGVLARAHRSRTHLQFAEHQGRAVGSRRGASSSVGGRSAGERGHRGGEPVAPREGSAARRRACDLRQAARARADEGVERRAHRAGRGEATGSDRPHAHRRARCDADRAGEAPTRRACVSAPRRRRTPKRFAFAEIADATAESIQKVNQAIQAGGESYFRYRQIEMLPQIAPVIADALAAGEAHHDLQRRDAAHRRRRRTTSRA